ncbi:MAG: hypothetical protein NC084_07330 [Bacteroides sp.]|nr:hypothetical protein [Eubacterium sp.]MCM1418492.1 hypothetical protein [Roseburia sp.]MCM1462511.1 hypothetical protein [Bacteroides sp.]
MSKQTEKVFKDLNDFLDANGGSVNKTVDELKELINEFMTQYKPSDRRVTEANAETSDDFLELAESAFSQKQALKYAKKALELDPDNLSASVMVAEASSTTPEKLIEKYESLIKSAEKKLEANGYFSDENIGEFWMILETRPYMRLLDSYSDALIQCGRMRKAIAGYEKMLKLCKSDNLGARYRLMHLFAFFEDEKAALDLLAKYPEEESSSFLLPLSMLYYKLDDLREATGYLRRLSEVNKDTVKFLNDAINDDLDKYYENTDPRGYHPSSIEEFLTQTEENTFLFVQTPSYFSWALRKLKAKRK